MWEDHEVPPDRPMVEILDSSRTEARGRSHSFTPLQIVYTVGGLVALLALIVMLLGQPAPQAEPTTGDPESPTGDAGSGLDALDQGSSDRATPIADPGSAAPTFECPVTRPRADFVPPEPWSETPAYEGVAWHGTADLWTVVSIDEYMPRKSVWWSSEFTDGTSQPTPPIAVEYQRLDIDMDPIVVSAPGANAYTGEDGWFMINGREPSDPGCWLATGTYNGVSLSYIFEVVP